VIICNVILEDLKILLWLSAVKSCQMNGHLKMVLMSSILEISSFLFIIVDDERGWKCHWLIWYQLRFCSVDCRRFNRIWHLFEDEVHIFSLGMECTICLVIWESDTYIYCTGWQMYLCAFEKYYYVSYINTEVSVITRNL